MDRRVILASSLAVIASVFLIVGPLSYQQERLTGTTACVCVTVYHPLPGPPPPPPLSLVIGGLVAGVVLNFALMMRQDPGSGRRAAAGILVVSAVSMLAGDEFWLGGILGVVGGIVGLMQPVTQPARRP